MLAGNYAAAAESLQQALALYRDIGHRLGQAVALTHLGAVQRLTGDYPAAAASPSFRAFLITCCVCPGGGLFCEGWRV
jgi:hypothetical protein